MAEKSYENLKMGLQKSAQQPLAYAGELMSTLNVVISHTVFINFTHNITSNCAVNYLHGVYILKLQETGG